MYTLDGVATTRGQGVRGAGFYCHYPILTTRSYSHYQILFSLPDLLFSILLRLACPETVRDGEDGPLQAVESISGL